MKGILLLAVATCLGFIFYNRNTAPNQPENTTGKMDASGIISQGVNDSIRDTLKHYEQHNSVPQ